MASDPYLEERMRQVLKEKKVLWEEKRMFGGNAFMVDDKMCFGTFRNGMVVRVDPEEVSILLERDGAEQMYMKDRLMKGYLMLSDDAYDMEADLEFWIQKCLDFNPNANSSKKPCKSMTYKAFLKIS